MENQKYPLNITLGADVDQFQVLVQAGAGTFSPTTATTAGNDGAQLVIAQFTGESGDVISGNLIGVDKAIAGGAIDQFDELVPSATGRVVALAGQLSSTVFAKALDSAAAAGDVIRVQLYEQPRVTASS